MSIVLAAVGDGGIEELGSAMDNGKVSWALLRMEVGSGTFARKKMIAITCKNNDIPVVQRTKLVARTPEAMDLFGATNANLEVFKPSDCTVDFVLNEVLPIFVADSGNFSADALRAEYDQSVRKAKAKRQFGILRTRMKCMLALGLAKKPAPVADKDQFFEGFNAEEEKPTDTEDDPKPEHERGEKASVSLEEALQSVSKARGDYNWAILEPTKLELHNAGCGGLDEMKEWLDGDKVMFGVLRLTFGKDPPVTKHVFIHWIGPKTSTVKRGQWNDKVFKAETLMKTYLTLNQKAQAYALEELDLADIISDVMRTTYDAGDVNAGVTHDKVVEGSGWKEREEENKEEHKSRRASEVEQYYDTLSEEMKQRSNRNLGTDESEEAAVDECEQPEAHIEKELPSLEEAISTVTSRGGHWNWALLTVGDS